MRLRTPWILVVAGATLAACFSEEVPDGLQIVCAANGDCPSGFLCRTSIGRCAPSENMDQTPPALDGSPQVTPEAVRAGATVTVQFKVTEPLAQDPVVHLGDGLMALDATATDRGALTYRYRYQAAGSEPEGTSVPLTIDLVDVSGNPAPGLAGGSVQFDFTAPRLVSATKAAPAAVTKDVEARISLAFNEPLAADPVVTMAPASGEAEARGWVLVSTDPASGTSTYSYVASGGEREGEWQVEAVATDVAGNVSSRVDLSRVVLDFRAPEVAAVTEEPESGRTRPGQIAQVTVALDEAAAGIPALAGDAGGRSIPFQLVRVTDGLLVFQHVVAAGEDGDYSLVLSGVGDAAGNALAAQEVARLVVDGTPPALEGYTQSGTGLNAHDTLAVEFGTTEPLAEPPLVKLGGWPMTREGTGEAPYRYTLPLAGTGAHGAFEVQVAMTDLAGNGALEVPGVVALDTVPPELLDLQFSPPVARLGITAYLTVTATERLSAPPTLEFAAPGDPGFTFVARSGQSYTFALAITGEVDPGVYQLSKVTLQDEEGNDAVVDPAGVGLVVDFTVDNAPPQVTNLLLSAGRFSAQPGHDEVGVTFEVSKPLDPAGGLEVLVGSRPATCVPANGGFQCSYQVLGDEREGPALVKVSARDLAGNLGYESASAAFDFTPPHLVGGTALLESSPPPGSLVGAVRALAAGATARLFFMTDEPVGAEPVVRALAPQPDPATSLQFSWAGGPFHQGITTWCSFRHVLDAATAHPQGAYAVEADVVDDVGNAASFGISLEAPGLVVDTVPPAPLTADQLEGLRFRRMPWGTAESGGVARFSVARAADGVLEPHATLVVWAGPDTRIAREIGRATADAAGDVPEAVLLQEDRVSVYLSVVDEAGLLDSPTAVRLRRGEWFASLGGKVAGSSAENPHRFLSRAVQDEGLRVDGRPGVHEEDGAALALPDGTRVSSLGAGRGVQLGPQVPAPPSGAVAFDRARGRLVASAGGAVVFEWDGARWQSITAADPEGDGNPTTGPLVYAETVGGVVMVVAPEVWAWTGASWRRLPLADPEGDGAPAPVGAYSIAFDSGRGRLVLLGGTATFAVNSTWEWTGRSWVRMPATDPEGDGDPGRRSGHAMAYDAARHKVVLFGGQVGILFNRFDTWEWDGVSWRKPPVTDPEGDGNPAGRQDAHSLVFDAARGTVVMYGRTATPCEDKTWEWNGTSWKLLAAVDPEGDGNPEICTASLAFDSVRQATQLLGGGALWTLAGSSWRKADEDPEGDGDPVGHDAPAAVYDGARGEVVLFGGQEATNYTYVDETWVWNGASWRRVTPADPEGDGNPSPRYRFGMVYDSVRDVAVLFGGETGTGNSAETWEWNGASWRLVAVADPEGDGDPGARRRMALAFDSARGKVVLFGGRDSTGARNDTWEYDGASWRRVVTADPEGDGDPLPRGDTTMTFDPVRGKVVMFGGYPGGISGDFDDTWEYDGSSWRLAAPLDPEGDGNPPPGADVALVFDTARGTSVLVGEGFWEWNGVSWRKLEQAGGPSVRIHHAAAYVPDRDRVLVFAGYSLDLGDLADTWEQDLGAGLGPAQTFSVALDAASLDLGSELLSVEASFLAGATGEAGGQPLDGVSLEAWAVEGWRELATSGDACVPGGAVSATVESPEGVAQVNLVGGFHFAVRARGSNGKSVAEVATDYAEARVEYRLP